MAYRNTRVQTFFLPHDMLWLSALKGSIAAVCSANLVCDENNSILIRQLFYLRIEAFLTDYWSLEIGYRWSSTVKLLEVGIDKNFLI